MLLLSSKHSRFNHLSIIGATHFACICSSAVKLLKQDQEIKEMKQKIAEVMAVSPGVSYVAPRTTVPQYLKFLNSERYVLNPRGLMYQCLRK